MTRHITTHRIAAFLLTAAVLPSSALAGEYTYQCVADIPGRAQITHVITAANDVHAYQEFVTHLIDQGVIFTTGAVLGCTKL